MLETTTTDPLVTLYQAVAAGQARRPKTVRDLPNEDRAEYMRLAKRRSRERQREATSKGSPLPKDDVIRTALADAAIIMLATGAPGAGELATLLAQAFPGRVGVSGTVRARAQSGRLKPKLLTPERLAAGLQ